MTYAALAHIVSRLVCHVVSVNVLPLDEGMNHSTRLRSVLCGSSFKRHTAFFLCLGGRCTFCNSLNLFAGIGNMLTLGSLNFARLRAFDFGHFFGRALCFDLACGRLACHRRFLRVFVSDIRVGRKIRFTCR